MEQAPAPALALRARWAERLGDHELLARERPSAAAEARATVQREAYKRYLLAGIASEATARAFIDPLEAVLTPAELVDACAGLIDAAVNATAGHAIERLDAHPDYPVCPAVSRLLARADPERHHPYAVHAAARSLLRRGIERERAVEVVLAFARVRVVAGYKGNPFLGELALLLLEHAPARAAVTRWTQTHVLRATKGPGYGWEEVQEANVDGSLAHEIDQRRAWADAVRAGIDPDFDRVMWG